jgi:hypothetical protein
MIATSSSVVGSLKEGKLKVSSRKAISSEESI